MNKLNKDDFWDADQDENSKQSKPSVSFICPNCKEISQDDVIFLCNTCKQEELIYKDGVYMCPSCLLPGENFECMLCGSKEVRMKPLGKKGKH